MPKKIKKAVSKEIVAKKVKKIKKALAKFLKEETPESVKPKFDFPLKKFEKNLVIGLEFINGYYEIQTTNAGYRIPEDEYQSALRKQKSQG